MLVLPLRSDSLNLLWRPDVKVHLPLERNNCNSAPELAGSQWLLRFRLGVPHTPAAFPNQPWDRPPVAPDLQSFWRLEANLDAQVAVYLGIVRIPSVRRWRFQTTGARWTAGARTQQHHNSDSDALHPAPTVNVPLEEVSRRSSAGTPAMLYRN